MVGTCNERGCREIITRVFNDAMRHERDQIEGEWVPREKLTRLRRLLHVYIQTHKNKYEK